MSNQVKRLLRQAQAILNARAKTSADFKVDLFENPKDKKPSWSGKLKEFLQDNEDLDPKEISELKKLKPGASIEIDLGAGGAFKIQRQASPLSLRPDYGQEDEE